MSKEMDVDMDTLIGTLELIAAATVPGIVLSENMATVCIETIMQAVEQLQKCQE